MIAFVDESSRDAASPFYIWGKALLDDPRVALSDILSGRGARGAQQRAEPEDFLADLLAHPAWRDRRTQLAEGLDSSMQEWIEARFEWSPARISRFGVRAYAAQISDALKAAARLPLKATAQSLIREQSIWDSRFRGLRWPGDIDLLQQFDWVLAHHQDDTRFVSRWFAACDEAAWGSPYWRTSLSTGLLGLRKLPGKTDDVPEMRVAAGLARFGALAIKRGLNRLETQSVFQRRAAALTVLYPRHDRHWQDVWERVLCDLSRRMSVEASTIRSSWLDHVTSHRRTNGAQPSGGRQWAARRSAERPDALPNAERRMQLGQAMDHAKSLSTNMWSQIREMVRAYWAHASGSGESYFAVRTTHFLCDRLLRLSPSEQHLFEVHSWTLRAIEAEPENAYVWDLWAKVLSALGRDDASLSIRWESIRRFPDNCVLRSSLAELLLECHRDSLAENLLRETMRDFPDDVVGRHILVTMLWRQGREEEAEAEFVTLEAMAPDNDFVQSTKERMATTQSGEAGTIRIRFQEFHLVEDDAVSRSERQPRLVENGRIGHESIKATSEAVSYLNRLANRVSLLENYFAPSASGNDIGTTWSARVLNENTSEFELVAAHRTGLMDGPEQREHLRVWSNARPSSFSARLLLAWHGLEGNGLDLEAMSQIDKEFPQFRRWNNALCYGFLPRRERQTLLKKIDDGNEKSDKSLWHGRLAAVFPDLKPDLKKEETEHEGGATYDPAALKRLLEDVAFAGAERALPSVSLS